MPLSSVNVDSAVENGACMGDISFSDSSIKGLGFWSKSNFIVAKGNLINTDGTTESFEPRAAEWNANASTDWGLTQAQIDSQIFKEW